MNNSADALCKDVLGLIFERAEPWRYATNYVRVCKKWRAVIRGMWNGSWKAQLEAVEPSLEKWAVKYLNVTPRRLAAKLLVKGIIGDSVADDYGADAEKRAQFEAELYRQEPQLGGRRDTGRGLRRVSYFNLGCAVVLSAVGPYYTPTMAVIQGTIGLFGLFMATVSSSDINKLEKKREFVRDNVPENSHPQAVGALSFAQLCLYDVRKMYRQGLFPNEDFGRRALLYTILMENKDDALPEKEGSAFEPILQTAYDSFLKQ